jgi:hypothetical protein
VRCVILTLLECQLKAAEGGEIYEDSSVMVLCLSSPLTYTFILYDISRRSPQRGQSCPFVVDSERKGSPKSLRLATRHIGIPILPRCRIHLLYVFGNVAWCGLPF